MRDDSPRPNTLKFQRVDKPDKFQTSEIISTRGSDITSVTRGTDAGYYVMLSQTNLRRKKWLRTMVSVLETETRDYDFPQLIIFCVSWKMCALLKPCLSNVFFQPSQQLEEWVVLQGTYKFSLRILSNHSVAVLFCEVHS